MPSRPVLSFLRRQAVSDGYTTTHRRSPVALADHWPALWRNPDTPGLLVSVGVGGWTLPVLDLDHNDDGTQLLAAQAFLDRNAIPYARFRSSGRHRSWVIVDLPAADVDRAYAPLLRVPQDPEYLRMTRERQGVHLRAEGREGNVPELLAVAGTPRTPVFDWFVAAFAAHFRAPATVAAAALRPAGRPVEL